GRGTGRGVATRTEPVVTPLPTPPEVGFTRLRPVNTWGNPGRPGFAWRREQTEFAATALPPGLIIMLTVRASVRPWRQRQTASDRPLRRTPRSRCRASARYRAAPSRRRPIAPDPSWRDRRRRAAPGRARPPRRAARRSDARDRANQTPAERSAG